MMIDYSNLRRGINIYSKKIKHRLKNIGDNDLEIIEVQIGNYLGEDDIIRFEDKYEENKTFPNILRIYKAYFAVCTQ